jgi:hypothetical protein
MRKAGALRCTVVALVALAFTPAIADAETRQFFDSTTLFPTGDTNGTFGPANKYPSSISVAGVSGTVTNVTVTLFGYSASSADDNDIALVGPNGQKVMLVSDACGGNLEDRNWTFDDAAPGFPSNNGPCDSLPSDVTFRPSNYLGNAEPNDDFSAFPGGPPPPYVTSLSLLTGGSPNGSWNLFAVDDTVGVIGFVIRGWGLTLEVEPPPPSPPGGGAGAGDTTAPDTQITAGPKAKSTKRKASFAFTSTEPGSTFECKLDDAAFAACSAPLEIKVEKGKHSFEVRATDASGNIDTTPATQTWKVKKKKKND